MDSEIFQMRDPPITKVYPNIFKSEKPQNLKHHVCRCQKSTSGVILRSHLLCFLRMSLYLWWSGLLENPRETIVSTSMVQGWQNVPQHLAYWTLFWDVKIESLCLQNTLLFVASLNPLIFLWDPTPELWTVSLRVSTNTCQIKSP